MGTKVDNLEDEIFDLKEQLSFVISEMNRLEEQNKSLQAELDREIKNNRKLVLGLKMVAYMTPKAEEIALQQAIKIAQDVLKEIGEEE